MSLPWHVLGVGAMGGLFARRLGDAGIPVRLLDHLGLSGKRTLCFQDGVRQHQVSFLAESVLDDAPIHRLLICTKSHTVLRAVEPVVRRLTERADIVLLVNGMGIAEQLRSRLPGVSIIPGTTTAGCYRDHAGCWHMVASGKTILGRFDGESRAPPEWLPDWQRAVPGLDWAADIKPRLLEKLAINAVINPATALFDVPNGALLGEPYSAAVEQAAEETAAILAAIGEKTLSTLVLTRVKAVASATAANTSSMRADLQAGRETEVEAILGYLLETLKQQASMKPDTPVLDSWLERLRDHDAACAKPRS